MMLTKEEAHITLVRAMLLFNREILFAVKQGRLNQHDPLLMFWENIIDVHTDLIKIVVRN